MIDASRGEQGAKKGDTVTPLCVGEEEAVWKFGHLNVSPPTAISFVGSDRVAFLAPDVAASCPAFRFASNEGVVAPW